MIKFAVAGLALGVLLAVSLGVTVTILLMLQETKMRDPVWFKEFEREYNEREDRLDEIREKTKEFKEQLAKSESLWRKRNIPNKEMEYSKNLEKENG